MPSLLLLPPPIGGGTRSLLLFFFMTTLLFKTSAVQEAVIYGDRQWSSCNEQPVYPTIDIGLPLALSKSKTFTAAQLVRLSHQLFVKWVNTERGGVVVGNQTHMLRYTMVDDGSDRDTVTEITSLLTCSNSSVREYDFILGPYSSFLSLRAAQVVNETGHVMLAPVGASTPIYVDRPNIFGTLVPAAKYTLESIKMFANRGAKTIAYFTEPSSFAMAACAAVPDIAEEYGMTMLGDLTILPKTDVDTALADIVSQLQELQPDIVLGCAPGFCGNFVSQTKIAGYNPKGVIITACNIEFVEELGSDMKYVVQPTLWHETVQAVDAMTGWDAQEFQNQYMAESSGVPPTYQAASAFTAGVALVTAIEAAGSLKSAAVREALVSMSQDTLLGRLSFDENGQNANSMMSMQFGLDLQLRVVAPAEYSIAEPLYPIPTWAWRDCDETHACSGPLSGVCQDDGSCVCLPGFIGDVCNRIIAEVDEDLRASLRTAAAACLVLTGLILVFVVVKRRDRVLVTASFRFLLLSLLGAGLLFASVFPLTEYSADPDDAAMKASCVSSIWLAHLGAVVFLAPLLAKTYRVSRLFNDKKLRKVVLPDKKLLPLVVVFVSTWVLYLLVWTIADAPTPTPDWKDNDLKTFYKCKSSSFEHWGVVLLGAEGALMFWGVYLSWTSRGVPLQFNESKHLTLTIYNTFFMSLIIILLVFEVSTDVDTTTFLICLGIFVVTLSALMLLYGIKIYYVIMHPAYVYDTGGVTGGSGRMARGGVSGPQGTSAKTSTVAPEAH